MKRPVYVTGLVAAAGTAVVLFLLGWIAAGLVAVAAGCWIVTLAGLRSHPRNWTPAETDPDQEEHR